MTGSKIPAKDLKEGETELEHAGAKATIVPVQVRFPGGLTMQLEGAPLESFGRPNQVVMLPPTATHKVRFVAMVTIEASQGIVAAPPGLIIPKSR